VTTVGTARATHRVPARARAHADGPRRVPRPGPTRPTSGGTPRARIAVPATTAGSGRRARTTAGSGRRARTSAATVLAVRARIGRSGRHPRHLRPICPRN
jgi:hypothetical protein